jgi:4-diphosphocytidyl-2-C-methyl-D-erythritol kinase
MHSSFQISSPAKLNLALSVGSPNEAGMHPIASWMVAVNFSDSLTLEKIPGERSEFEITFDTDEETGAPLGVVDWPIEKDLCFRAHAMLEELLGKRLPTRLRLRKRIPAGAGLGGGSGNAAQTLTGLDRLFDLHVHPRDLLTIARRLGSDVAFHLGVARGIKSAIVTGLGDELTPAPRKETIDLVLILPPFGCPTGPVYQAFDKLHGFTPTEVEIRPTEPGRVKVLTAAVTIPQNGPFNDLAEPACIVRPELREVKSKVEAALRIPIHITGSGSTLFVIAPTALTAKVLARKVTATTGLRAIATRTL